MLLIPFMPQFLAGFGLQLPIDLSALALAPSFAAALMQMTVLAQEFNTNVFADFWTALDNFIASGQAWALLIGLVLGYLIRGFTTYG